MALDLKYPLLFNRSLLLLRCVYQLMCGIILGCSKLMSIPFVLTSVYGRQLTVCDMITLSFLKYKSAEIE